MKKLSLLLMICSLGFALFFITKADAAVISAAGPGGGPQLRYFNTSGDATGTQFFAFNEAFHGGVDFAVGDVDGDGWEEVVVGAGKGGGPQVRIFSHTGELKYDGFFAFEEDFHGGVSVATADIDNDDRDEIVVGPLSGKASQIKIFDQWGTEQTSSFVAFGEDFTGGVSLAAGDIDFDHRDEIFIGAGEGGGPQIRIFEADGTVKPFQFFAFSEDYHGGVNVAGGDVDLDGKAEIGVCQRNEQAWCKIYRYNMDKIILNEWKAYGDFEVGADIDLADTDGDGYAEVITGAGETGAPHVEIWDSNNNYERTSSFYAFSEAFRGGVNVSYIRDNKREYSFMKGMSYPGYDEDVYGGAISDGLLEELSRTGNEWVSLVPVWVQQDKYSTNIYRYYTATDESVRHAIDKIHALGMKVLMKPYIDPLDGTWRAEIEPASWSAWFSSYQSFINHYAAIAEEKDVEMFSIGVEYNSSESQVNEWRQTIQGIRERYSGLLTYSANFTGASGYGGGYQAVQFWNDLDYIGIDAYYVLTDENDPLLADLKASWNNHFNGIESWREREGYADKQIIFPEVGYSSYQGDNTEPWNYDYNGKVPDWQEQADCYEALFSEAIERPWFSGMFFWLWDNPSTDDYITYPHYDVGFTPRGKTAEWVLRKYYLSII